MKNILRSLWLFLAIATVFILAFTPLLGNQLVRVNAQPAVKTHPPALQSAQDVYLVDVIVLNLYNIDFTAGTYSLDFYISLTCKNPPCKNEPNWDLMNSTLDTQILDQGTSVPFKSYDYRVKANMIGRVDYDFYPFDYLYIDIFVEDKKLTNDQLDYKFSSITVDQTLFNPSGWFHSDSYDGGYTDAVTYGSTSTAYDRLDIWLFLERDWFGAFMKTIFAAVVIVMVGMLSFLMKTNAVTERLALTSSTLVAIVLYHISLVSGVPATGYLTFTDKFMVWTYLIVFLSLMVSVMIMVYVNTGRNEKAERLQRRTRWLIPLLWLLFMAFVFVKDLFIPYNILLSTAQGAPWWPKSLEWLAKLLGYTNYLPIDYFIK